MDISTIGYKYVPVLLYIRCLLEVDSPVGGSDQNILLTWVETNSRVKKILLSKANYNSTVADPY